MISKLDWFSFHNLFTYDRNLKSPKKFQLQTWVLVSLYLPFLTRSSSYWVSTMMSFSFETTLVCWWSISWWKNLSSEFNLCFCFHSLQFWRFRNALKVVRVTVVLSRIKDCSSFLFKSLFGLNYDHHRVVGLISAWNCCVASSPSNFVKCISSWKRGCWHFLLALSHLLTLNCLLSEGTFFKAFLVFL